MQLDYACNCCTFCLLNLVNVDKCVCVCICVFGLVTMWQRNYYDIAVRWHLATAVGCQGVPTWSFAGVGAAGICDIGNALAGAASAVTISLVVDILLVCAIFIYFWFFFGVAQHFPSICLLIYLFIFCF